MQDKKPRHYWRGFLFAYRRSLGDDLLWLNIDIG
jgi:hypothetical protein